MKPRTFIFFVVAAVSSFEQSAFSAFITHASAQLDRRTGIVDFHLTFDQVPDFLTVDMFGRQADSFQLYNASLGTDSLREFFLDPSSVIRGEEIHIANDIRARSAGPPSSDPNAGGWGNISGVSPFVLNGSTLNFSLDESVLGFNGDFVFLTESVNFGSSLPHHYIAGVPEGGTAISLLGIALTSIVLLRRKVAPAS
jgi:hypothetical protein